MLSDLDEIDVNPFQRPPGKLEFYTSPKPAVNKLWNIITMGPTSHKFIRISMFAFNFIFVLLGIGLIAAGAVARITYHTYFVFLDAGYSSAPIFMIFVGTTMTVTAFLGCFGSLKSNACMLMTFAVFLGVLFIMEISGGIAAYVERSDIENYVKGKMNETLYHYATNKTFWDPTQVHFKCCGVESYRDWIQSNMSAGIPESCCTRGKCNTTETYIKPCGVEELKNNCPIFIDGCVGAIEQTAKDHIGTLGGFGIAVAFIQLIGLVLACVLAKRIRSGYVYS